MSPTVYDFVVIATPLKLAGLQIAGLSAPQYAKLMASIASNVDHIRSFVTLLPSPSTSPGDGYRLSPARFNLSDADLDALDEIFVGGTREAELFNHIEQREEDRFLRIHSNHQLLAPHLRSLFGRHIRNDNDPRIARLSTTSAFAHFRFGAETVLSPIQLLDDDEGLLCLTRCSVAPQRPSCGV